MEITLNQIDVTKINLLPGDFLMVTIKADLSDWTILDHLSKQFQESFPNNRVIILGCGPQEKIEYSVVSDTSSKGASLGYCVDCDCGKKEQESSSGS